MDIDNVAIQRAARALEAGKLVAFPTETVYGLGGDAENPDAIAAIYAAKGRPANHPVIVHIAPQADVTYWATSIPKQARVLMESFWPGPLTLILRRAPGIPDAVSGGQDSIGLRCPSHPVVQALLQEFKGGKGGIAGPSANKFGHVSPTTAQHVWDEFGHGGLVSEVLDGGQSEVGIESTIVDLSRAQSHGAVLLRPGQITIDQLTVVLGAAPALPDAAAPRASGTLAAHYAPRAPVALVSATDMPYVLQQLSQRGHRVAVISYSVRQKMQDLPLQTCVQMPATPVHYAHDLYATLREMDQPGIDLIVVETLPQEAAWQGINDRLRRAAHDSIGILARLLA